jgi:hypothetical protein
MPAGPASDGAVRLGLVLVELSGVQLRVSKVVEVEPVPRTNGVRENDIELGIKVISAFSVVLIQN